MGGRLVSAPWRAALAGLVASVAVGCAGREDDSAVGVGETDGASLDSAAGTDAGDSAAVDTDAGLEVEDDGAVEDTDSGTIFVESEEPVGVADDADGDGVADADEPGLGLDPEDPDFDDDYLLDGQELEWGTEPDVRDSDNDGLLDGIEVNGDGRYDYLAVGCDPLHRDALFEVDYQVIDGASVHPRAAAIAALEHYYASIPVPNPDGTSGIHVVFEPGVVLDSSEICFVGVDLTSGTINNNPFTFPKWAFRKVSVCIGDPLGSAPIRGQRLKIQVPAPNGSAADDATERAVFWFYSIFLHEAGHALGLLHGGDQDLNRKVNYPSVMNYRYDETLNGSPKTLAGTRVGYSAGRLAAIGLNNCHLDEAGSFSGVARADLTFMTYGPEGFALEPGGTAIDWNRDGDFSDVDVAAPISEVTDGCVIHRDHDDFRAIARDMGDAFREYWP